MKTLFNSHAVSHIERMRAAGQSSNSEPKSSNRVWLPRLESQTARRVHSWRAVSRLVGASYAIHEGQLSQFKQATQFEMRRRPIARTYCLTGFYGVQILSPLSVSVSLVRVPIGELSVSIRTTNPRSHIADAEGFSFGSQ